VNAPRLGNTTGVNRTRDPAELAEITSFSENILVPKSRELLNPGEAEVSLPHSRELPNAVAPLTDILGTRLTLDNPAWSADPVPAMRLLQKTLLAHSLEKDPEKDPQQRADLLKAIELVEQAVKMRLRWQQMRRSEIEMLALPAAKQPAGERTTTEAVE